MITYELPVTQVLWERGTIEAEVTEFEDLAALEAATPDSLSGKIAFVSFKMKHTIDGSGYREAVVAGIQGAIAAAKKV